ncbi:hypothetical protein WH47_06138, partial [Habropoda laboriosa]
GCRAGKSFKSWKKRVTEQRLQLVSYSYIQPPEVTTNQKETEVIDLTLSDDEETVILPPSEIEVLDTSRAIQVFNHEEIPDESGAIPGSNTNKFSDKMTTRSKTEAAVMQQAVAEEDLLTMQRQIESREKRVRDEARVVEQRRRELEADNQNHKKLRAEIEQLRAEISEQRRSSTRSTLPPPSEPPVEDEACETVTELCNRLKDIFGPQHTVDHYRCTLVNTYMKSGEHILDYISQIKDLSEAIIDCNRQGANLVEIDSLTVTSFINGLTPDIRSELRGMRSAALNTVSDEAVQVYNQREVDKTRYGKPKAEQRKVQFYESNRAEATARTSYQPPQRPASPYSRTEQPPLPWRQMPPRRDSSPAPPTRPIREVPGTTEPPRRFAAPARFCNYCRIPGHDVHKCRKRMYNNAQRPGNEPLLPARQDPNREEAPKRVQTVNQESENDTSQT